MNPACVVIVFSAKAGIHPGLNTVDPGLRRDDGVQGQG